jgi:hypothetical protein
VTDCKGSERNLASQNAEFVLLRLVPSPRVGEFKTPGSVSITTGAGDRLIAA